MTVQPGTATLEELELPRANLLRLAKQLLPEGTQIQKEARIALSKATTVFISYLCTTANDIAKQKPNKKTVSADDLFKALEELEFEDFIPELTEMMNDYRTLQSQKRAQYRAKSKESSMENLPTAQKDEQDEEADSQSEVESGPEDDEEESEESSAVSAKRKLSEQSSNSGEDWKKIKSMEE